MPLTFGCTSTYRSPANKVCDVLWADQVQIFDAGGQSLVVDITQQTTGYLKPLIDLETIVHQGIIDEPFPADCRARFFKIHAHDDDQLIFQRLLILDQLVRIFKGSVRVMNRTGSNNHSQAIIVTGKDATDIIPASSDRLRSSITDRNKR